MTNFSLMMLNTSRHASSKWKVASFLRKLYFLEILKEPSIETRVPKENFDTHYIRWWGELFYGCYLGPINFNSFFRDTVAQDNTLTHREMAFLPIQCKILFFLPFKDLFKVGETMIEWRTKNLEIIHEDLHNFLY